MVMGAASGLLLASNRNMLAENGGHVCINRPWAQSPLERMQYVKQKAMTFKGKYSLADFKQIKNFKGSNRSCGDGGDLFRVSAEWE